MYCISWKYSHRSIHRSWKIFALEPALLLKSFSTCWTFYPDFSILVRFIFEEELFWQKSLLFLPFFFRNCFWFFFFFSACFLFLILVFEFSFIQSSEKDRLIFFWNLQYAGSHSWNDSYHAFMETRCPFHSVHNLLMRPFSASGGPSQDLTARWGPRQ